MRARKHTLSSAKVRKFFIYSSTCQNCLNYGLAIFLYNGNPGQQLRFSYSRLQEWQNNGAVQTGSQKNYRVTIRRNFEEWGNIMEKKFLEVTNYDELVYKLTLKYLRQKGYDIGNNTIPRVKHSNICM